jgi:hypothetical protein
MRSIKLCKLGTNCFVLLCCDLSLGISVSILGQVPRALLHPSHHKLFQYLDIRYRSGPWRGVLAQSRTYARKRVMASSTLMVEAVQCFAITRCAQNLKGPNQATLSSTTTMMNGPIMMGESLRILPGTWSWIALW